MIDVRLERIIPPKSESSDGRVNSERACGECHLVGIDVYFVNMDVAGETLTLAPCICLQCISSIGITIQQKVRERLRQ